MLGLADILLLLLAAAAAWVMLMVGVDRRAAAASAVPAPSPARRRSAPRVNRGPAISVFRGVVISSIALLLFECACSDRECGSGRAYSGAPYSLTAGQPAVACTCAVR